MSQNALRTLVVLSAFNALLTLAFKILANRETHQDAHIRLKLLERLADASGPLGMVGGQMIDMLEDESPRDLNTITRMQRLKTGALISYSVEAGGIIGGANEAERQALALMEHPNISRVIDAGTTTEGRPYFAMELVSGAPLTS